VRLIDRYILRGFRQVFWLALAAFSGIYLLVEFVERIDDLMEKHAVAQQYAWYFIGKLPGILVQVTPLAVLLATFLCLGGLSRRGELTAMRAGGIGLVRIALPLLAASLVVALGLLLVDNYLVPFGSRKSTQVWRELNPAQGAPLGLDNLWLREQNRFIRIRLAEPEQQRLQGVTIFEVDGSLRPLSRLDAPLAHFSPPLGWVAPQATRHLFHTSERQSETMQTLVAQSLPIQSTPEEFEKTQVDMASQAGLVELYAHIERLQQEGFSTRSLQIDLLARVAAPLTCLIMAFIGIPFSLQRGRNSNLALGVSISVAIGVIFHLVNATLLAFGTAGTLPPWIAAWSANLLFFMLGSWMLLSVRQ